MAPPMAVPVEGVPLYHWYERPVPVAVTLKLAEPPKQALVAVGWVVIAGAAQGVSMSWLPTNRHFEGVAWEQLFVHVFSPAEPHPINVFCRVNVVPQTHLTG
jgi:hypothetical protein